MTKRGVLDAKAKARRQKKLAIGGAVLLVLLLAIQLPRTLKLLHPKQAAAPTAAAASAVPAAAIPAAAGGSSTVPAAGGSTQLVDSESAPSAGEGQLVSFERFASKDPFTQQVALPTTSSDTSGDVTDLGTLPPVKAGGDGAAGGAAGGSGSGGDTGFSTGTGTGATTTAAPPATATTISVNDEGEVVATGADFPAADPSFSLVKLAADGKSVEIGIAGGALATGKDTVKLQRGKPLTLMNTADGTRYTLVLLTVQGF